MSETPAKLVDGCKNGDLKAQAKFVEMFRSTVTDAVRAVFPADLSAYGLDDVVNEAWHRVFQAIHRWNGGNLHAFVHTVARRKAIDILRGFRLEVQVMRHSTQVRQDTTADNACSTDPQAHVQQSEREEQLRDAVRALAPPYRTLIEMRFWQELTFSEIGERLDIPESTARVRLASAISQLAHRLKEIE